MVCRSGELVFGKRMVQGKVESWQRAHHNHEWQPPGVGHQHGARGQEGRAVLQQRAHTLEQRQRRRRRLVPGAVQSVVVFGRVEEGEIDRDRFQMHQPLDVLVWRPSLERCARSGSQPDMRSWPSTDNPIRLAGSRIDRTSSHAPPERRMATNASTSGLVNATDSAGSRPCTNASASHASVRARHGSHTNLKARGMYGACLPNGGEAVERGTSYRSHRPLPIDWKRFGHRIAIAPVGKGSDLEACGRQFLPDRFFGETMIECVAERVAEFDRRGDRIIRMALAISNVTRRALERRYIQNESSSGPPGRMCRCRAFRKPIRC